MEEIVGRLGRGGSLNGYASFGDAGRMQKTLQKRLKLKGKMYVIHDKEGMTDMVERGSVRPVGEFVKYDYNWGKDTLPDSPEDLSLSRASVDLVTVNMGLHHFTNPQLPRFLRLCNSLLRQNGLLVIREHDSTPELIPILDLAHSTFNAVNGVSEKEEEEEVRAFRSVRDWRRTIEWAGFEDTQQLGLEPTDPTEDYMMVFTKKFPYPGEKEVEEEVRGSIEVKEGEKADPADSFFRHPEWVIVDCAQALGSFMNHTPFYQFPFRSWLGVYWGSLIAATKEVMRERGVVGTLKTTGFIMHLLVAPVSSGVLGLMELMSLPIRLATKTVVTKGGGDFEKEVLHVQLDNNKTDINWAEVDPRIKVLQRPSQEDTRNNIWKIELPRHVPFTPTLQNMAGSEVAPNMQVKAVGGQTGHLAVRLQATNASQVQELKRKKGEEKVVYDYSIPGEEGRVVVMKVSISRLLEFLREVERKEGIEVVQVYDLLQI
uniref:Methyltransferase type 11 domain-containing protein n=1 Tax=Paramoeba aestuarina TaxID=180227 RepID=A0A7S4NJN2_9EUKA